MKMVEIILDRFIDSRLFEMARSRKDARDLVTESSPQLITHLIKLFVFNSPNDRNHWITEINTWLDKIDDIYLKPDKEKPDWETLYNWIIRDSSPEYNADFVLNKVSKLKRTKYQNVYVYEFDAELVINEIFSIILRVCHDIAVPNKFTSITEYLPKKEESDNAL